MACIIWNAYSLFVRPEEDIAHQEYPLTFEGVTCFERASFLTAYDTFWDAAEIVRFFRPGHQDLTGSYCFASHPEFVEQG